MTCATDALYDMLRAMWGVPTANAYLACTHQPAERGVRIHPDKQIPDDLADAFTHDNVPWCPYGFYAGDLPLGKDPMHATGSYYIQEPSAMAPVTALAPQPGEAVLDLCAAPGGKTTQIAGFMHGQGFLLANEPHPERCLALAENLERWGAANTVISHESPAALASVYPATFDAILVDAPCSGEGMFRKEPEARLQWTVASPLENAERQLDILESAYTMLAGGGRIVYSTCTFNPLENEAVSLSFVARHADLYIESVTVPGLSPGFTRTDLHSMCEHIPGLAQFLEANPIHKGTVDEPIGQRIAPVTQRGEGQFLVRIGKRQASSGSPPAHAVTQSPYREVSHRDPLWMAWNAFVRETLHPHYSPPASTVLVKEGHTLYAVPDRARKTRHILRPGLPLFHMPHKVGLPTHALAMSLRESDVSRNTRLPYGDSRILTYLHGEGFTDAGDPGWTLVTVEGSPLGFGKRTGDMVKNHYPKGLRRAYAFAVQQPASNPQFMPSTQQK